MGQLSYLNRDFFVGFMTKVRHNNWMKNDEVAALASGESVQVRPVLSMTTHFIVIGVTPENTPP